MGELTRYVRNCTNENDYRSLRDAFIRRLRSRKFPFDFIRSYALKVKYEDRLRYLYPPPKDKRNNTPLLLNITWNSYTCRLPFRDILLQHWCLLEDPEHRDVFKDKPIISFSRGRNISELTTVASRKFTFARV